MGWFTSPSEKKKDVLKAEVAAFAESAKQRGGLAVITVSIALKPGEQAFLEEQVTLKETRSFTKRSSTGGALRVMKGVYVGGSSGTSRSHNEWRDIDTGTLIITNQRIIFDGRMENRVMPIDRILSVNPLLDGIEVSIENKQKSSFFTVKNSLIWTTVFNTVHAKEIGRDH